MKIKSLFLVSVLSTSSFFAMPAVAQLRVEITGAGANRLPVAIADFAGERAISQALTSVIRADLDRSGMFRLIDGVGVLADNTNPAFADLKQRGADAIAGGSTASVANGRYETRLRLWDVPKQNTLNMQNYVHTSSQLRMTAHRIADTIYENLTGEPGIFSTRIAYVVKAQDVTSYKLPMLTAQMHNRHLPRVNQLFHPPGHLMATNWPMSLLRQKKPIVYVHDLATAKRHVAATLKAPTLPQPGHQTATV